MLDLDMQGNSSSLMTWYEHDDTPSNRQFEQHPRQCPGRETHSSKGYGRGWSRPSDASMPILRCRSEHLRHAIGFRTPYKAMRRPLILSTGRERMSLMTRP